MADELSWIDIFADMLRERAKTHDLSYKMEQHPIPDGFTTDDKGQKWQTYKEGDTFYITITGKKKEVTTDVHP